MRKLQRAQAHKRQRVQTLNTPLKNNQSENGIADAIPFVIFSLTQNKKREPFTTALHSSFCANAFWKGCVGRSFSRKAPSHAYLYQNYQYIPPIPGAGAAGAGFSSFLSATTDSVVRMTDAMDAAFCRAERVTFVGSTMPDAIISQ